MPEAATTIFACASGEGKSGIAVYRISGPRALPSALVLLRTEYLPPRSAAHRMLTDPTSGEPIDEAVVLYFPKPGSFTGEDVVELQVHGSPAVDRCLHTVLADLPGMRLAEPGEFTRRAFENGRLDLAQVEGLADLIQAETDSQRRLALRTMSGNTSEVVYGWRDRILRCLALVEAAVDFPEEGEDTAGYSKAIATELTEVANSIQREIAGSGAAERLRSGIEVAVIGPANTGKSMLINNIVGRELAISTPLPGTTRDIIEARLEIRGLCVTLLDTAGIRAATDIVEAAGIERTEIRARNAELRIHLSSPDVPGIPSRDRTLWIDGDIEVQNKCDLPEFKPVEDALSVSALTGEGLSALIEQIGDRLAWIENTASHVTAVLRRRKALEAAKAALDDSGRLIASDEPPEIVAERLRGSLLELERFAGSVSVDDVLDVIFAEFCLGK